MNRQPRPSRSALLARIQRRIESDSWPRLQMVVIAGLTACAGLAASFALLLAGVDSMAMRYPLALACAYGVFLFLLWIWLRTRGQDGDLSDPGIDLAGDDEVQPSFSGGGGQFGGGGASGRFDDIAAPEAVDGDVLPSVMREAVTAVDADELAIPLLALGLIAGMALASFYIVYVAPMLFAELLLDGVLACSLYRHLQGKDRRHWLDTACRRTLLPFALTAVFLGLAGVALEAWVPGARSLGEAITHAHVVPAER